MISALTFILFLLACFGLAWACFMAFAKTALFIGKAIVKMNATVNFMPQVWVGSASFAGIMGYIFIL